MAWIWALLFLVSCQRHSQWQCHHIREHIADTTRIVYRSEDPTQGIDIEMFSTNETLVTYLQVHSAPLPSTCENEAEVTLSTAKSQKSYFAPYHLGAQRVRLTEILQNELIFLLQEGSPVTIELIGYRETIDPSRFQKVFQRLHKKAPFFQNKIHIY